MTVTGSCGTWLQESESLELTSRCSSDNLWDSFPKRFFNFYFSTTKILGKGSENSHKLGIIGEKGYGAFLW
jgi:hypothetical protein